MEIDRKTLKALAADTRLDILKSLGKRRKTPSELAKELNLAASTVVEHLNRLEEADLIRREETGHKWIYYNLTEKGSSLVRPKIPTQFVIVLGLCILAVFIGFFYYNLNYTNLVGTSVPAMLTVPESQKSIGEPQVAEETKTGGAATAGTVTNITNVTNSTNLNCTDSDGGKNYYLKGFANPCPCFEPPCPTCGVWADNCLNESTLLEYSCENLNGEEYYCPHGCKDGACS